MEKKVKNYNEFINEENMYDNSKKAKYTKQTSDMVFLPVKGVDADIRTQLNELLNYIWGFIWSQEKYDTKFESAKCKNIIQSAEDSGMDNPSMLSIFNVYKTEIEKNIKKDDLIPSKMITTFMDDVQNLIIQY
jgi:hypothetical protein